MSLARAAVHLKETEMNLPKIDLSTLPDLDKLTGVFGSIADTLRVQASDDSVIILMTFIYNVTYNKGAMF